MKINLFRYYSLLLCLLAFISLQAKTLGDGAPPEFEEADEYELIFYGGFERQFANEQWHKDWGAVWSDRVSQAELVDGRDALVGDFSLRVAYPKGGVGNSETGIQFPIKLADINGSEKPVYEELYLRYYVYFERGFDWALGGKLPGLMGGEESHLRSGGDQPDGSNGWTMRLMWREEGKAVAYAYLPPGKYKEGKWGTDIDLDDKSFYTGYWISIEQYIKVNSIGKEDGILQVWLDGDEVLYLDDVVYRTVDNDAGKIGGIHFSTFHGGNTISWAPRNDSYIRFDGISLSTERPEDKPW